MKIKTPEISFKMIQFLRLLYSQLAIPKFHSNSFLRPVKQTKKHQKLFKTKREIIPKQRPKTEFPANSKTPGTTQQLTKHGRVS